MKRLTPEKLNQIDRLRAARWRKHMRRQHVLALRERQKRETDLNNRLERSRHHRAAMEFAQQLPVRKVGQRWLRDIDAPTTFRFGVKHSEVCAFVDTMRLLALGDIGIYLNLAVVKDIGPAAALYFAAELDRQRHLKGHAKYGLHVHDWPKWDPVVRTYLAELGLYDLLGIRNPPKEVAGSRRRVLKMRRDVDLQQEKIPNLRRELEALVGGKLTADHTIVYDAILEAMQNVVHHAYQEPDPNGLRRIKGGWWWTAAFESGSGDLQIVLLDQGAGIPVRLPHSDAWGWASGFMKTIGIENDATSIRAALEYRKSTHERKLGRGRGFQDIMALVETTPGSWMRVLSGRGECMYRPGRDIQAKNHDHGIVGTIVQWNLRLAAGLQGS